MSKQPGTKRAYNALFEEHCNPKRVITGKNNYNCPSYDQGISCHVFALASPASWEKANEVNVQYSDIGTERAIERLAELIRHEFSEEDKKEKDPNYQIKPFPRLTQKELEEDRTSNMKEIQDVRNQQETVLPVENMFLVGGFREGQSLPEHMWIEDHTNNMSYDTFINRGGVAVVNGVGKQGKPFKPGCEGSAFKKDEIQRVKADGYTWGQLVAIASGAEQYGFPEAIANTPQVLAAKRTVEFVNQALDKIPEPELTLAEQNVLKKVEKEQKKKETQKKIDDVVEGLGVKEKEYYQSALDKIAKVAEERRSVAREIVGLGYNPLPKLTQKCDEINPGLITEAVSMKDATECKKELLDQLSKLELYKECLPENERDIFQSMINEKREQIDKIYSPKLTQKCDEINPGLITEAVSMKDATECKEDLLDQLSKLELYKEYLPENERDIFQSMINKKREQIDKIYSDKKYRELKKNNTIFTLEQLIEDLRNIIDEEIPDEEISDEKQFFLSGRVLPSLQLCLNAIYGLHQYNYDGLDKYDSLERRQAYVEKLLKAVGFLPSKNNWKYNFPLEDRIDQFKEDMEMRIYNEQETLINEVLELSNKQKQQIESKPGQNDGMIEAINSLLTDEKGNIDKVITLITSVDSSHLAIGLGMSDDAAKALKNTCVKLTDASITQKVSLKQEKLINEVLELSNKQKQQIESEPGQNDEMIEAINSLLTDEKGNIDKVITLITGVDSSHLAIGLGISADAAKALKNTCVKLTDASISLGEKSKSVDEILSKLDIKLDIPMQDLFARQQLKNAISNSKSSESWKQFLNTCIDMVKHVPPETAFIRIPSVTRDARTRKVADFDSSDAEARKLAVACVLKAIGKPRSPDKQFGQTSAMEQFIEKFNSNEIIGEVRETIYDIVGQENNGQQLTIEHFKAKADSIIQMADHAIEKGFDIENMSYSN